jgi:hypothetical protein
VDEKNKPLHVMAQHGFEQGNRFSHVVAVIHQRLVHRFTDLGKGREMHDRVECMLFEKPVQQFWIPETSLYKFTAAHQPPVSGGQVVQNNHLPAVIHQLPNHMRADIPCPTDNENFFITVCHFY